MYAKTEECFFFFGFSLFSALSLLSVFSVSFTILRNLRFPFVGVFLLFRLHVLTSEILAFYVVYGIVSLSDPVFSVGYPNTELRKGQNTNIDENQSDVIIIPFLVKHGVINDCFAIHA